MNWEATITVGELVEMLSNVPADLKVISEGCDCYGEVVSVEVEESDVLGKHVALHRQP